MTPEAVESQKEAQTGVWMLNVQRCEVMIKSGEQQQEGTVRVTVQGQEMPSGS